MQSYGSLKQKLLSIGHQLSDIITQAQAVNGTRAFTDWQQTVERVSDQIQKETLRVAVVGSIKSGKSTFVNALLEDDALKRGAGVVTSIVTRVRRGSTRKATLFFKSWDEINAELQHATSVFPTSDWRSSPEPFDLRRSQDRKDLEAALSTLTSDQLIASEGLHPDSVLLLSHLKGYERVKNDVSSDNKTRTYPGSDFEIHRDFVGDDALAVYLKDVQLDIDTDNLVGHLEIADCQGSDSPNPHHLAMIQDYLVMTHLIVYVISSRTGLRRADVRFLNMIKKMGILENILFVFNADFSEHDALDDLVRLRERVVAELSLVKPDPPVFAFSSLFELFRTATDLSDKDRARLDQWEADTDMDAYCSGQFEEFKAVFQRRWTRDRYALLLTNHLERLNLVTDGISHWSRIQHDLLTSDAARAESIAAKLSHQRKRVQDISSVLKSTLDGASEKIKTGLRNEIDRFFDPYSGQLLSDTIDFVRGYRPESLQLDAELEATGFRAALYRLYQEFKQAVGGHMTESVNPEIVRFMHRQESTVADQLQAVSGPYDAIVRETLDDYNRALEKEGLTPIQTRTHTLDQLDMEAVKRTAGLSLPPAAATMHYSAKIKAEATMRLGINALARWLKRMLKKPVDQPQQEGVQALKSGLKRMKRETEASIKSHFRDHNEMLKFQFLFKLVDAAAATIQDRLSERFSGLAADMSGIAERVANHQLDRTQTVENLQTLGQRSKEIETLLEQARQELSA